MARNSPAVARRKRDGGARPRSRLKPLDRERMIVAEAVRYFAEVGPSGSTSALAKRLGITQPLLFNYFPTKELLIGRIYDELLPRIWKPEWRKVIEDGARPLPERLIAFYRDYAATVLARDQFRLFLFAGILDFENFGTRYNSLLRKEIFPAVARALVVEFAAEEAARDEKLFDAAIEIAHTLHGSIFHLAMRKWVYLPPLQDEIGDLVPAKVMLFLDGASRLAAGRAKGKCAPA